MIENITAFIPITMVVITVILIIGIVWLLKKKIKN
ncbi:hypothetical protein KKC_11386 [Listeria fleischmannii subsp. coloradonensis]|jgi:heme/copper-type cytochrome/quinol oxidase subunit 4|nr:hypothetical protein KKC_11386 [Listeria fleischmannii subsp. coloradonensis]STY34441.1 Uncharacterised protein [Listeria fleischmannii subsp. coloradonensis]